MKVSLRASLDAECAAGCRLDQLLEQVDQGSQVVAVEPIQITEDIAVPRRDSDLTAWVRSPCSLQLISSLVIVDA